MRLRSDLIDPAIAARHDRTAIKPWPQAAARYIPQG
jgi:hypothetical protein